MLTRELTDLGHWCDTKLVTMATLNKLALEDYRKTWTQGAGTRARRRERLSHFLRYCVEHGWVRDNFAAKLGKIKVPVAPTLPLTKEQFAAVLYAAQHYNPKSPDAVWRRQRAVAMLLVLRWSGLRISDAAKLACDRLQPNGSLHLYTEKTGMPVYVKLPPYVVKDVARTAQRTLSLLLLERHQQCRDPRQSVVKDPEENFQSRRDS